MILSTQNTRASTKLLQQITPPESQNEKLALAYCLCLCVLAMNHPKRSVVSLMHSNIKKDKILRTTVTKGV